MVVAKIVPLLLGQIEPVVTSPSVADFILPPNPDVENTGSQNAEPHEPESQPVSKKIPRCLGRKKNVGSDNARAVADRKLDGSTDTSLVVAAEVVVEPHHGDGLRQPASARDEVQGEIACLDGDVRRREQDAVADCRDKASKEDETEPVFEAIREYRHEESDDGGCDVDGNGHVLGA